MNRILAIGCDYDRTLTNNFLEISKEGIEIPFPQSVVHLREEKKKT